MINLYLSSTEFTPDWLCPYLAPRARVAVMAADRADRDALIAALAVHGVTASPLAPYAKPSVYDAVVACGVAAPALAGLSAESFHLELGYTRTDAGDERMQAIAQANNSPVFALGERAAILTVTGEDPRFFGEINAYYPIMPLEVLE